MARSNLAIAITLLACLVISIEAGKKDVVFLLDTSWSVSADTFESMKTFINRVLNNAPIDNGDVQVGVATFSTNTNVQFNLNQFSTKSQITSALDDMSPNEQDNTNVKKAIVTMRDSMFSAANGDRSDAENICVLIIDGLSNIEMRRVAREAGKAHTAGIKIYAIGLDLDGDTYEIEDIASDPDSSYSFAVDDLSDVQLTLF